MRTPLAFALLSSLATPALAGDPPPAAIEVDAADRAKMAVCTDGKSHYVAIAPHERVTHQLYYGDGKNLSLVLSDAGGMMPGTDFFEPRYVNPTANDNFRGLDMRVFSSVDYDADHQTCALRCGTRKVDLKLLPAADGKKLATGAAFHKSPRTREAYALARDDHGTYYYVDHGNTAETKNSFRVYVGKKGALKLQKMKDIASDSEGEVYSTVTGDLRLITSRQKQEFTWIQGGKETHLVALPIQQNAELIYTTLGVYTGQRFGTPCDDM